MPARYKNCREKLRKLEKPVSILPNCLRSIIELKTLSTEVALATILLILKTCDALRDLHNLKNVKNTLGGLILLVKLQSSY